MKTENPTALSRHSEADREVLKKLFGANQDRWHALRNLFYQFELSKEERSLLDLKPQEYVILKQFFLPIKHPNAPLWKQTDMYTPLLKVREWNPEIAEMHISAQDTLIDYMNQQFTVLVAGSGSQDIILDELATKGTGDERFINMLAYQGIGAYLEGFCQDLWNLANPPKEETTEERATKLAKNSTK